jgi:hypothetical protein
MTREQILQTEWNPEIDELCKNRMVQGFYSYGPRHENYGGGLVNARKKAEAYLETYIKTGNREKLLDAINFLRIEFDYPSHKNPHFEVTGDRGITDMTFRDIERVGKE